MNAIWKNLEQAAPCHWVNWYGKGPFMVLEEAQMADRNCYHLHNGQQDMGWFEKNRLTLQAHAERCMP